MRLLYLTVIDVSYLQTCMLNSAPWRKQLILKKDLINFTFEVNFTLTSMVNQFQKEPLKDFPENSCPEFCYCYY